MKTEPFQTTEVCFSTAFKVEKVAILELRSHAAWYLKGISGMNDYKKKFFQATTKEDIIKIVKEIKENGIC